MKEMKLIIVIIFGIGCVVLAENDIKVIRQDSIVNPDGYSYAYELDNGVKAEESGKLKDEQTLAATGLFEYISPEGEHISLAYVADENGFQPQGDHLPTPHPIPDVIQKALEYIASHPPQSQQ